MRGRDARLRAEARGWSGDREDHVRLLALARREGEELAGWRLSLAASLGEPLARAALGLDELWICSRLPGCVIDLGLGGEVSGAHDPGCSLPNAYQLERWFRTLGEFGAEVSVRGALAVARHALEWWDRLQGWGVEEEGGLVVLKRRHYLTWSDQERHERPRLLLDAVERYVLDPTPARAAAVRALPKPLEDERPFRYLHELVGMLEGASEPAEPLPAWWTIAASASFFPEERVVRDALREALIPWALGELDPLLGVARLGSGGDPTGAGPG